MNTLLTAAVSYNGIGLPIIEESPYQGNCFFSMMGLWSLLLAIAAIALSISISYLIDRRHKWYEQLANRYLTHAFVIVWLFGFVVYDIGMYTGQPWSLLGNAPMAILHAFGIFVLDSDVSAIHDPFHSNGWYMFGFSLAHFLAAFVSLVFVLKHFGFSIIAAFKRKFTFSSKETTYIFWGMNDATYYLAKDIKERFAGKDDFRIVVVRTNNDTDTAVARNGMERLFNFLSLKNKDIDRLKELGCVTMSTYTNLATIDSNSLANSTSVDIINKVLRLKTLRKIIRRMTTKTIHLFFFSDNDDANILAIANLRNDSEIQSFAKKGQVKFYCHARYNSIHRVIEDEMTTESIEVKVVDSSHIDVELMKKDTELHPVNYVNVESDGTVSSAFNALVIGFGEVGLDTVRFLYEYGSFVKSGETKVKRSNFCCHVVDQDMKKLAGVFTMGCPSLDTKLIQEEDEEITAINLYNMDCRSIDFYQKLEKWIETLHYVVVATGDDETNVSLAIRLFRLAIRKKEKLNLFRILVRVQHDENGHIHRIVEHYNRLWAAEKSSSDSFNLHQHVISSSERITEPITLFGAASDVYTYEHVVNDSLRKDAKRFKKRYDLSVNELRKKAGKEPYPIKDWNQEQNDLMQLAGENKGYSPTYSGVMKLRRVQSQNMTNSLHTGTKILLAKKALGEDVYNGISQHGLTRESGSHTYSWRDRSNLPLYNIQRVLDVLAQTEHLRWEASHRILGYQNKNDEKFKDEARLFHGCMKDWDELSYDMQSNDYDVVDVSLNLIDTNDKEE